MTAPIQKSILGIAGEFAVAAELCRRNIYAQLTLGNLKRVDLLTMSQQGQLLKIEVKAKQSRTWANIKGISAADGFLVFVDFANRSDTTRPDFFILTAEDWLRLATAHVSEYNRRKNASLKAYVDQENCPVYPTEITSYGKPYRGCSVRLQTIAQHHEAWTKILDKCVRVTEGQTDNASNGASAT